MKQVKPAPASDAAPKDEWLTQKDCRQQIIWHATFLLVRAAFFAALSLTPAPPLFVWLLSLVSLCVSEDVYKIGRAVRNYRTIKTTGKPIPLTPFRKASHAEGEQLHHAVVMSVLALLMIALLGFMCSLHPPTKPGPWIMVTVLPWAVGLFVWQQWGRWGKRKGERLALSLEAAPANAAPVATVDETPVTSKHWWTDNNVREETQKVGRREQQ